MQLAPEYLGWAIALGVLSAISLPLGSAIGLIAPPRERIVAVLGAFGAGALLAALAVELVAPTLAELEMHHGEHETGIRAVLALIAGCLIGGVLFVVLDRILSERGAFLRKTGTAILHFSRIDRARRAAFLTDLCGSSFLSTLTPEAIASLAGEMRAVEFANDEYVFREGDASDQLYFIRSGELNLIQGDAAVRTLGPGDLVGELALLTHAPRAVSAQASGSVSGLSLSADSFAKVTRTFPEIEKLLRELGQERLEEYQEKREQTREERDVWTRAAINALQLDQEIPSAAQLRRARAEHNGAGFAIWLGMLLDGIPESIVIGGSFAGLVATQMMHGPIEGIATLIPYTLIAGLFLANLPEALSSSVAMRTQGFRPGRIMGLWMSQVLIAAIGAGIGYQISGMLPVPTVAAIEGLAAGAMLTAIASSMIPEAVHMAGGHAAGLGTLVGFLSAVAFKLLE